MLKATSWNVILRAHLVILSAHPVILSAAIMLLRGTSGEKNGCPFGLTSGRRRAIFRTAKDLTHASVTGCKMFRAVYPFGKLRAGYERSERAQHDNSSAMSSWLCWIVERR
jgi:hypothetical protein